MNRTALALLALLAPLALGATACGPHLYALPATRSCAPEALSGALRAAAVNVDITPPIGLSLFGHGLEGRIAAGLITHLGCRGFVFRKAARSLAWVTCDLQSVSLSLSRRVAELVRAETEIGADRLILSATHTHAGPAHFSEARAFITALGGSREPSYDQQVIDFIARRVADGIIDAHRKAEPVEIRSALPGAHLCVRGLSRNRAMPAFLRNPAPRDDRSPPCVDPARPLDPAHAAVNRELTLLRIDKAGSGSALGVMGVFAVHPTAIGNINDRYHGDLFAFASRYCEDTLEARGFSGATCALANGAEGDVSPDWAYQGELEARRLGARLGAYMIKAFDDLGGQEPDPQVIGSRYKEIILPSAQVDNAPPPACNHLTPYAEVGTPVGGGAPDGPTRLRIFEQLNEGVVLPERADPCNRPRAAVLGVVPTNLDDALAGYYFPVRVPIEWFRIGRQGFVAVPGEATTFTGALLEAAAQCGAAPKSAPAEVQGTSHTRTVGLTNGYLSYIATADEYQAQYYEGAETVYGPRTADFFRNEITKLVCDGAPAEAPAEARCEARGAVERERLAEGAAPPYRAEPDAERNPNLPPPSTAPTQPAAGEVGAIYMSPEPVRSRWPSDLPVDRACWSKAGEPRAVPLDPRNLGAPPEDAGTPFWTCQARAPALEVSWKDTPSLPLCGASIATLLANRRPKQPFYVAHAAVDPPYSLIPEEFEPIGAQDMADKGDVSRALESATRGQFRSLADNKGPAIDDEHGFVQLWFDDDEDRWHARFRAPEYIGWAREARLFRFAIRSSSGAIWVTKPARWDPYHPPCEAPARAAGKGP